ncbi:MAG TPA: hypothetical protein DEF01_02975 [Gemmatimonadetes bacterium]|nr:hypothetical protein [Gemmatimonadota bacterium]|tara:strand:- start:19307 stop:19792 length:486 start_codon:yes stop_codon:yes gene_type:complete
MRKYQNDFHGKKRQRHLLEVRMILHLNFEELTSLRVGVESVLDAAAMIGISGGALNEELLSVEALHSRLSGDLSLETLEDLAVVKAAVSTIVARLRVDMETCVLSAHPADTEAVEAYFDYAHCLAVAHRIKMKEAEMEGMIELVTASPVTPEAVQTFDFPD